MTKEVWRIERANYSSPLLRTFLYECFEPFCVVLEYGVSTVYLRKVVKVEAEEKKHNAP